VRALLPDRQCGAGGCARRCPARIRAGALAGSLVHTGHRLLPLKLRAFLDFATSRLKERLLQASKMTLVQAQIRKLTPLDADRYRDIRLEALQNSPEAYGSTFEAENAQSLPWFEQRLRDSNVFGAFQDGELIGVVGYFTQRGQKRAHKGVVWGMYVRPAARNSGLGTRLIESVVKYARDRVELLQLTVVSENVEARHLYTRQGFVEYGLEKNALKQDGCYYDEVLMALSLV
jgi:RimJ/RimL family protein N-acetyltransferase